MNPRGTTTPAVTRLLFDSQRITSWMITFLSRLNVSTGFRRGSCWVQGIWFFVQFTWRRRCLMISVPGLGFSPGGQLSCRSQSIRKCIRLFLLTGNLIRVASCLGITFFGHLRKRLLRLVFLFYWRWQSLWWLWFHCQWRRQTRDNRHQLLGCQRQGLFLQSIESDWTDNLWWSWRRRRRCISICAVSFLGRGWCFPVIVFLWRRRRTWQSFLWAASLLMTSTFTWRGRVCLGCNRIHIQSLPWFRFIPFSSLLVGFGFFFITDLIIFVLRLLSSFFPFMITTTIDVILASSRLLVMVIIIRLFIFDLDSMSNIIILVFLIISRLISRVRRK